jgi:hypothetical protein
MTYQAQFENHPYYTNPRPAKKKSKMLDPKYVENSRIMSRASSIDPLALEFFLKYSNVKKTDE